MGAAVNDNLDVLSQRHHETKKPVCRKTAKLAANEVRDISLVDVEKPRGLRLT